VTEFIQPDEPIEEDSGRARRRPLSASIDHIIPVALGGTHTRSNVQITHLFCNLHKNTSSRGSGFRRPEYVRALLTNLINGTPIPEEIHRGCFPSWAYPASKQVELMTALYIAVGKVAADPRYGNPASRLDRIACELGPDRWQAAVADMRECHAKWRSRWQTPPLQDP